MKKKSIIPEGTELARAFEAGRRQGRREREALEDRILKDLGNVGEVVDELRVRYQLRIAGMTKRGEQHARERA
jgi:hypothetical protein